MREQIYRIINKAETGDKVSKAYDMFICFVALVSLIPILFRETNKFLDMLDLVTVYFLLLDYVLHWTVADMSSKKHKGALAFVLYPITPLAIIDLAALLPTLGLIGNAWRALRVLRIVKICRYSTNFGHIINVMQKEKQRLMSVLVIAVGYIFVSAIVMFSYEVDTFDNFFEALYWATTALTTVGYGDVYPVTMIGRLISMLSSVFGIAVIALPAGIITGGFLEELNRKGAPENDNNDHGSDE